MYSSELRTRVVVDTNPIEARSKYLRGAVEDLTRRAAHRTEQNINSVASQHSAPVARGYTRHTYVQKNHTHQNVSENHDKENKRQPVC